MDDIEDRRVAPVISHCLQIEELLDPFLDGELSPALLKSFNRHLEGCDACRDEVMESEFLLRAARSLRDSPLPPGVAERLREGLRERVGYEPPARKPLSLVK